MWWLANYGMLCSLTWVHQQARSHCKMWYNWRIMTCHAWS